MASESKRINISVFSGVSRWSSLFKGHKYFSKFISYLPFLLIPFVLVFFLYIRIVLFRGLLNFQFTDATTFITFVLTSNAILAIIVSAIAFFYKETFLQFTNSDNLLAKIRKAIEIIASSDDIKAGVVADFMINTENDFLNLKYPNDVVRRFATNAHILSYISIFISTLWAVLYSPIARISEALQNSSEEVINLAAQKSVLFTPLTSILDLWSKHNLHIGICIVFFTFTLIFLYGSVSLIFSIFRLFVNNSINKKNITKSYMKYSQAVQTFKVHDALPDLDDLI